MIHRLALIAILCLGVVALWEDLRHRRISNLLVLAGLFAASLGYLFLLAGSLLGTWNSSFLGLGVRYLPLDFYPRALAHWGLVFSAALLLWRLCLWPAGDAKLFIAFAGLIVLANPNLRGFPSYLFLVMLINIFVPAALFVLLELLVRTWRAAGRFCWSDLRREVQRHLSRIGRRLAEEWERVGVHLRLGANTLLLFLILQPARNRLEAMAPGVLGHVLVYLAMFALWDRLSRLLSRRLTTFWVLPIFFAVFLSLGLLGGCDLTVQVVDGIQMWLGFGMFLFATKAVAARYLEMTRVREVPVEGLRPGMILAQESWESVVKADPALARYSDGLSESDIEAIRSRIGARPQVRLLVCESSPFSPWLFLGTLWTLFSPRDAVQCLLAGLRWAASLVVATP